MSQKSSVMQLPQFVPKALTSDNGEDVALSAIAERIVSLITLMGNKWFPIVILVDREKRQFSACQIIEKLTSEITDCGIQQDQIRVCVADRMVENWILFDKRNLSKYYDIDLTHFSPCEGSGKGQIKKIIKDKKRTYHETTDGVKLFCTADPKEIYASSKSYRQLIDSIDFPCQLKDKVSN